MIWQYQGKKANEEEMATPHKRLPYAARGYIEDALRNISKVEVLLVVEIDKSEDPAFIKRTLKTKDLLHDAVWSLQQVTCENVYRETVELPNQMQLVME